MSNKQQVRSLIQAQQWTQAKDECAQICREVENDAEAWFLLGSINGKLGNFDEAEACCRQAIVLRPDITQSYYNLGVALRNQGKMEEAAENFQTTIRKMPNFIQAYIDLGAVLLDLNEPGEAVEVCRAALRIPNAATADGHANLGVALYLSGAYEEAASCFQKSLQLKPGNASAHHHLGSVLCCQGKLKEALSNHQAALRRKPNEAKFYSSFLLTLHYDSEQNPGSIFTEHLRWGGLHGKSAVVPTSYANQPDPSRRLRIGYMSPDFRNHSVAYFLEPLLAHHDPATVEIFCYSDVKLPDSTTCQFETLSHHWRKISGMDDAEVFDAVQADGIDILVDLAGHTANCRLGVFAQKPAPVQITYLGYPDTTGLSTMDYRFTDGWADPPGMTERFHTESLVRLPHGFLCYQASPDAPPAVLSAVEAVRYITFGSFSNLAKINDAVVSLWAGILKAVPGARLIIKNKALTDVPTRERYHALFEASGIPRNRLDLLGFINSHTEHLDLYKRIDIALDTFPYNGTTTTCEALWMGVPVVTLAGVRHSGRVGVSLLNAVGLEDWIAETPEQYVAIAAQKAADIPRLVELRAGLRERIAASPLCEGKPFAVKVEAAYREMWRKYCAS